MSGTRRAQPETRPSAVARRWRCWAYDPFVSADGRAVRAAQNESIFRELNEHLEATSPSGDRLGVICECADLGCAAILTVTTVRYEAVRADPQRFVVAPFHVDAELEQVVERHDNHWVVVKTGRAGDVADALEDTP